MRPDDKPACAGNPEPYSQLIDGSGHFLAALAEARRICGIGAGPNEPVCPVRDQCLLVDFKDEPWAKAIRTGHRIGRCGRIAGYRDHIADGTEPCRLCKRAHDDYLARQRVQKAKERARKRERKAAA